MNKEFSILKVLAYFNQFSYPVSREEITFFLSQKLTSLELSGILSNLKDCGLLFQFGIYYSLQNNPALYERRVNGNRKAAPMILEAYRIAQFLFRFPYVRGVCISGSLSKKFADAQADIDFFVITRKGRLWVARTLLHLFKKLSFLTGRQHCFCMNYFIDEEALQIEEKNDFTAMELFTLLPASGNGALVEFFAQNLWAAAFFPAYEEKDCAPPKPGKIGRLKESLEWWLGGPFGNWLDERFLKMTARRWKLKEQRKKISRTGRRMGLIAAKHSCKPNPVHFQQKLLARFQSQWLEAMNRLQAIRREQQSTLLN